MGAGNVGRMSQVATEQTQRNLRPAAQAEIRARAGFQQKGAAFERFMQDRALEQRMAAEQQRRSESPFG